MVRTPHTSQWHQIRLPRVRQSLLLHIQGTLMSRYTKQYTQTTLESALTVAGIIIPGQSYDELGEYTETHSAFY